MAKKDKVDGTPIEFYIPPSGAGLRRTGPRVPIPINQPHWKYKKYAQTRPTIVEWILMIFFALMIFTMGVLVLFSHNPAPVKWIFSIGLISVSAGIFNHLLMREKSHRANDDESQEEKLPRKKAKKQPRHRKDYK